MAWHTVAADIGFGDVAPAREDVLKTRVPGEPISVASGLHSGVFLSAKSALQGTFDCNTTRLLIGLTCTRSCWRNESFLDYTPKRLAPPSDLQFRPP